PEVLVAGQTPSIRLRVYPAQVVLVYAADEDVAHGPSPPISDDITRDRHEHAAAGPSAGRREACLAPARRRRRSTHRLRVFWLMRAPGAFRRSCTRTPPYATTAVASPQRRHGRSGPGHPARYGRRPTAPRRPRRR